MGETNLSILRDFLLQNLGLLYTERQEKDLYRKIESAASAFGYDDTNVFIEWLVLQHLSNSQTEKLAEFLTIGETYFLREKQAYDYLEFDYLPRLISERRKNNTKKLKIWSAGCASGEEPYTLAILLKRIIPDIKHWDITILATDINPAFLAKARLGVYSKWSFRKAPKSFVDNNFSEINPGRFQIKSSVKSLVKFSYLNLVDDVFPSVETMTNNVDAIFCRNVMIYFSPEGIAQVGNKFYNCINSSGILITSPVEVSSMQRSKFKVSLHNGCHVFDKSGVVPSIHDSIAQVRNTQSLSAKSTFSSEDVFEKLAQISRLTAQSQEEEKESKLVSEPEIGTNDKYKNALAYYKDHQLENAEAELKKLLKTKQDIDEDALLLLARIYAKIGQLEEANSICKRVLESGTVSPTAYYLQAVVFYELGKKAEAIRSAESVLFLDPNYALAHYLLACIRMTDTDKRFSDKHFDNLQKLLNNKGNDDFVDEIDQLTVGQLSDNIASFRI